MEGLLDGHILRKNCLLQRVIEGKIKGGIEVTGRRGRRHRKLLDDLKERRGYSHLKEEALYRTMWRVRYYKYQITSVHASSMSTNEMPCKTCCFRSTKLHFRPPF